MASLSFSVTGVQDLKRLQAFLDPKLYDKARRGGISYASKAVPTAVSKGISSNYNIGSTRVKQDIRAPRKIARPLDSDRIELY